MEKFQKKYYEHNIIFLLTVQRRKGKQINLFYELILLKKNIIFVLSKSQPFDQSWLCHATSFITRLIINRPGVAGAVLQTPP